MKKGIALSFLVLLVIGFIFFGCTAKFASEYLSFRDKEKESFNQLTAEITNLDEGGLNSLPFYLEDRSVLAGFSKGSNKVEYHLYYPNNPNADQIAFRFNRPDSKECPIQKACICLCRKYDLSLQEQGAEIPKCEKPLCKSFDNIDFSREKVTETYEDGKPKSAFKGGFLYFRKSGDTHPIMSIKPTFYVQKYKGIVDACVNSPCLNDQSKQNINLNLAIKSFNLFVQKYEECRSKQNTNCGTLSIKMPAPFYLYYSDYSKPRNGFYLVKGEFAKTLEEMEKVKDKDGNEIFYQGQLYRDEANEAPAGSILTGPELEMSVKDSKLILGVTGTFDIELPRE